MSEATKHLELMRRVGPKALADFLQRYGWRAVPQRRPEIQSFVRSTEGSDSVEIVAPALADLRDYGPMALRVAELLAMDQARPLHDIVVQMLDLCDVFKLTVESSETADGTVSVNKLRRILEQVGDLFIYAASAELRQDKYFPRRIKEASEIAEKGRFGQTEVGSFVATFYMPLAIPPGQGTFAVIPQDPPIERRMLLRIMGAVEMVVQAVEDRSIAGLVDGGVLNGNLCEALSGLMAAVQMPTYGFATWYDPAWTSTKPHQAVAIAQNAAQEAQGLLERAAEAMGTPSAFDPEPAELKGWVILLKRDPSDDTGKQQIKLLCSVDGQVRKVAMVLDKAAYNQAIAAHRDGDAVRVTGVLERQGKQWTLRDPQDFEVTGDPT